MSTRILHVIPSLDWGHAAKQLLMVLRDLPREDFDQSVCAIQAGGFLETEVASDQLCRVDNHRCESDLRTLRWLRRTIHRQRPHIVHAWGREAIKCVRLSASTHGFNFVVSPWDGGGSQGRFGATTARWLSRGASCEITCEALSNHQVSPACQRRTVAYGIWECRNQQRRWHSKEQLLAELGLPRDGRVAAVLGDFVPENGFHDAIWAAELLKGLRDDACLLLVGTGPWLHRLWRFRSLVGITDRVVFVSRHQPIDELIPLLDCLWAPNRRGTMLPSMMEAMGHGVPIVATDVAGNRPTGAVNRALRTFQPGHRAGLARQALKIFNQSDYFRSAAAKTRATLRAENSPKVVAKQYAGIYRDVVASSALGSRAS